MKLFFLLVLFSTLALAIPTCPSYPYQDFVWQASYQPPIRPPDSILANCPSLGLKNPELCGLISSNLTENEQKQVIIDGFVTNSGLPAFTEALAWNSALKLTKYAPDSVPVKNGVYLKDAWITITAINPSVTNNQTFVNSTGNLSLAYNFSFVVPKQTFVNDCKTVYAVCGYDYVVQSFNNGNALPNNQFIASPENNFSAVLTASGEYLIHHYKLKTSCSPRFGCITTCDYSSTEDNKETLSVQDNKTAFYQNTSVSTKVFVDNFENGLLDVWFEYNSTESFNSIVLSFENSFLKIKQSSYQLNANLSPYNFLSVEFTNQDNFTQLYKASIISREKILNGEKFHLLVPSSTINCSLEVNTHFETITQDACNYSSEKPSLELKVNKTNKTLFVTANFSQNQSLVQKNITFYYTNQTFSALTDSNGIANTTFAFNKGSNLVRAEFVTDFETKSAKTFAVIPAENPISLSDLFYGVCLLLVAWLGYNYLRRELQ